MKKVFYLTVSILFLLALSFTGCENEKSDEELLIGKWNMESENYTGYENGVKTEEDSYDYDPGEGAIEFLKDGTGKIYDEGVVEETFTWEIIGDILELTVVGENDAIEMDFTVSESDLILKFSFEETIDSVVYKEEMELFLSR